MSVSGVIAFATVIACNVRRLHDNSIHVNIELSGKLVAENEIKTLSKHMFFFSFHIFFLGAHEPILKL